LAAAERAAAALARLGGLDRPAQVGSLVLARLEASRALARAARRVLATSEGIRRLLKAIGIPEAKLALVPHAAPPLRVPARPLGVPLRVGFLGVLRSHKGAHVLVDAVRRMPRELSCEVVIRGDLAADPAYVAELRSKAAGETRIQIVDRVPYDRFGEAVGEIDVLVVPSIWAENAPIVLLSALEAGRYVVASNVPGLAGSIHGPAHGSVFPAGDSAALANALTQLVRDPTPVERVRARPGRFEAFPSYLDTLETIYRQAVGSGTAARLAGGVTA
jgi:glycosyltransferase involved in cell wall biosynthesis